MIETYKLLTGKYDQQVALALPKYVTGEYFTRGNSNKLLVKRCRYELLKNFFSNCIVNMWNSLPDYVVMSDHHHPHHRRFCVHLHKLPADITMLKVLGSVKNFSE